DGGTTEVSGDIIILSTGTRPSRPCAVPFDKDNIYDSDTILDLNKIPRTLTIIGAGVIGCEYACIFSALGVKVTLIECRSDLLSFADREVVDSLKYWMRQTGITLRLGEEVTVINVIDQGKITLTLKSKKVVKTEKVLYTMGRVGNTDALDVANIGIETTPRGLIKVNENYQTSLEHIYAVGDVIGFPSLASTSREQGRRAVCHAAGGQGESCSIPYLIPYGIYTIPEISMIGKTEEELTSDGVPYESGTALFQEVARGQISGDIYGMLKLLFHRDTRALLGVHIICERASELIHIGQSVMSFGGTIDYFRDAVFNYPTLSDAYKQAALNGINRL
ncbi:MAG: Si-specific NAD(P)(+) transhydrogenase, partial [Deltaproteobacteria bacterium]|nr:Si-specific NAD(P)(+) transhydrogenase [Deltaproteobacteria bacterium]